MTTLPPTPYAKPAGSEAPAPAAASPPRRYSVVSGAERAASLIRLRQLRWRNTADDGRKRTQ